MSKRSNTAHSAWIKRLLNLDGLLMMIFVSLVVWAFGHYVTMPDILDTTKAVLTCIEGGA